MSPLSRSKGWVMAWALSILTGCGSPPPPATEPEPPALSYADALQIYNQELLALDRLKAERDKLQQSLTPDASELVGGLLEQAGEARAEMQQALEDLDVPGQSAGQSADREEDTAEADPLQALGQQLRDAQQERTDRRDETLARIAELEQQIAEQQKRVDRAKVDKDAAEASRP